MKKNILVLPIKKKWFDMILSGEKKEEYREIKPYYEVRLQNYFGAIIIETTGISETEYELLQGSEVPEEIRKDTVQEIMFRNGYSKNSPYFVAKCRLRIGTGNPEWGAEEGKQYFILDVCELE